MVKAIRCANAAISFLLFAVPGYVPSLVSGDTSGNRGSSIFPLVISPTSGKDMYGVYCAGCHGEDGRGKGHSSRYCTVPPPDLTQLARNNHGIYPVERVCEILRHGTGQSPKGQGYMPIWQPLLKSMDAEPARVTEERIRNLAEYVKTLQDRPAAPRKRTAILQ
jgi:mono/diheme cytochrome c family protein